MEAHPLETVFLIFAVVSMVAHGILFSLKFGDLMAARRSGVNGPVMFMKWDNIRHQGFGMAISLGMVMLAVSGLNNPDALSSQTKNLVTGMVIFSCFRITDAFFTYRRRWKLALLVAQYEVVHGGRREYDPPVAVPKQ